MNLTYEYIQRAAQSAVVRKALQVKADKIKSRAESIATAEEVTMQVTTEAGIRPRGRPFVNVVSDNAEQEFGSSRTKRRRILGRAGEGG